MFWGRGWRWWFRATGLPGWLRFGWMPWMGWGMYGFRAEDELRMLEEIKSELEAELEDVKKRIEELKKELEK